MWYPHTRNTDTRRETNPDRVHELHPDRTGKGISAGRYLDYREELVCSLRNALSRFLLTSYPTQLWFPSLSPLLSQWQLPDFDLHRCTWKTIKHSLARHECSLSNAHLSRGENPPKYSYRHWTYIKITVFLLIHVSGHKESMKKKKKLFCQCSCQSCNGSVGWMPKCRINNSWIQSMKNIANYQDW